MHIQPFDAKPGDYIDFRGHQGTVTKVVPLDNGAGWLLQLADNADLLLPMSTHDLEVIG